MSATTRTIRDTNPDYDIAIIGAGSAGVAAAAAAGKSARVILIESTARLGGSVTAAMHRSMCGLYSRAPGNPLETLNAGVQRDLVRRMVGKDRDAVQPKELGKAWVLEFPTALWESSLAEIVTESTAEARLSTRVTAIRRESNKITAIAVSSAGRETPEWLNIKLLIDCTGGGHILKLAGEDAYHAPEKPDDRMLAGYSIRLTNIAGDAELLRLQIPYFLAMAVERNQLPANARFTSFYPGPAAGEGVCKFAVDFTITLASEAGELAVQAFAYLKREIPSLADAKILEHSPAVLPRDGLRLRGRYTLTETDILETRQIGPDAVHAWWPIEKWNILRGPSYVYPPVGRHYDISPDALRSSATENLLAAGTCLSATATAAASSRASGICLATGAAAGSLALAILGRQPEFGSR